MGFFRELSSELSQAIKDLDADDNVSLEENTVVEDGESTQSEGTGETHMSKLKGEKRDSFDKNYDESSYEPIPQQAVEDEINNIINSLEMEENNKITEESIVETVVEEPIIETVEEPLVAEETIKGDKATPEETATKAENVEEPEVIKQEIQVKKEEKERKVGTVITKNTMIAGDIATVDNMEIYGAVRGDVECKGSLAIFGEVTGNAIAANITINTAKFEGDLTSEGCVEIGNGTVVIGNITSSSSLISGAVKGEIDVCGPVVLESTAIVKGNIKAKTVKIDNGAVLQGFCELSHADVDIDDFFEPELPKLEDQGKVVNGSDDGKEDTSSKNITKDDEKKKKSKDDVKKKGDIDKKASFEDKKDTENEKIKEEKNNDDKEKKECENIETIEEIEAKEERFDFVLDTSSDDDDIEEFAEPVFNREDRSYEENKEVNFEVGELLKDDVTLETDDLGFVIEDNEIINENIYNGNKLSEL